MSDENEGGTPAREFDRSEWVSAMLGDQFVMYRPGFQVDVGDAVNMEGNKRLSYVEASMDLVSWILGKPASDHAIKAVASAIPQDAIPVVLRIGSPGGGGDITIQIGYIAPGMKEGLGGVSQYWSSYDACPACGNPVGEWGECGG